jgi:SAM-dependent methyltransferase
VAWYREWFGEEYLELYAHRDEREAEAHADFVVRQLDGPTPRAVLDLACGAGRHTAVLRRRGYRTLGVDLSLTLLAVMAERGLPRVAGDMRRLPFARRTFDWVLNFFTSFGYFEQESENFQVLEEIARVLTPGGRFLIDLLNPPYALGHLTPCEIQRLGGYEVEIQRWYDAGSKRINKRIRVHDPEAPPRSFLESVRAYDAEEVALGLRRAGLQVDRLCGDFDGKLYDRDSERLILIGHQPA